MDEAEEGKAAAKAELRHRMNLSTADVPLVGVVTRLTHQKGIHLIKHAAWRTLERGGQFVLLGSAPDPKVQAEFNALAGDLGKQYPDRARLWFAYDEPLSHLIYAGCDMFLVPSVFEPCGLTQMIAMRYVLPFPNFLLPPNPLSPSLVPLFPATVWVSKPIESRSHLLAKPSY